MTEKMVMPKLMVTKRTYDSYTVSNLLHKVTIRTICKATINNVKASTSFTKRVKAELLLISYFSSFTISVKLLCPFVHRYILCMQVDVQTFPLVKLRQG